MRMISSESVKRALKEKKRVGVMMKKATVAWTAEIEKKNRGKFLRPRNSNCRPNKKPIIDSPKINKGSKLFNDLESITLRPIWPNNIPRNMYSIPVKMIFRKPRGSRRLRYVSRDPTTAIMTIMTMDKSNFMELLLVYAINWTCLYFYDFEN